MYRTNASIAAHKGNERIAPMTIPRARCGRVSMGTSEKLADRWAGYSGGGRCTPELFGSVAMRSLSPRKVLSGNRVADMAKFL